MGMPLKENSEVAIVEDSVSEAARPAPDASDRPPVGERLAAARKAKGLSYQDVFHGTKIKIANLAAIETGDRAALPAVPFTAGFVKAYAQFLGLNPEEHAAAYRAECSTPPANGAVLAPIPGESAAPPADAPAPRMPRTFAPAVDAPVSRASRASPESYVSYFGIGATVLCALWIGARIVAPKAEQATPEARVESPADFAAPQTPSEKPEAAASVSPDVRIERVATSEAVAATMPVERKQVAKAPDTTKIAPAAVVEPDIEQAKIERGDTASQEAEAARTNSAEAQPQATAAVSQGEPAATVAARSESVAAGPSTDEPAPAAVATRRAVRIATVSPRPDSAVPTVVSARLTRNAEPKYPDRCAKRAGAVETVEVAFTITAEGNPSGVQVAQSSNECFNSAATDAAYRLRFSPKTVDGNAVVQEAKSVTFRFAR